MNVSDLNMHF